MLAPEFVGVYQRDPSVYIDQNQPDVAEALRRSLAFGRLLHDVLSDVEVVSTVTSDAFGGYDQWVDGFSDLESEVLSRPDGWEIRNELGFHGLNQHMIDMWEPFLAGGWKSAEMRRQCTNVAQSSLAFEGLDYYMKREKFIGSNGADVFFGKENEDWVGRFTGVLQEYDATIVVLDLVHRNPNLTVVPAPRQFERNKNPGINADLVVADLPAKKAVGVQIKTRVSKEIADKVDHDRIVLIDGTNDLGNVRALRTRRGSSNKQVKAWPGIISAKRVHEIPTTRQPHADLYGQMVLKRKFLAQQLVGQIRYDHQSVCQTIGDRILQKL